MAQEASFKEILEIPEHRLIQTGTLADLRKQAKSCREIMGQRVAHLPLQAGFGKAVTSQKDHQIPVGTKGVASLIRVAQGIEQAVVVGSRIAQASDAVDQTQQRFGSSGGVFAVVKGQQSGKGTEGADFQEHPDGQVGEVLLHELFGFVHAPVFHLSPDSGILFKEFLNDGIAVFFWVIAEIPHEGDLELVFNGKAEPQNQIAKVHIQVGSSTR